MFYVSLITCLPLINALRMYDRALMFNTTPAKVVFVSFTHHAHYTIWKIHEDYSASEMIAEKHNFGYDLFILFY